MPAPTSLLRARVSPGARQSCPRCGLSLSHRALSCSRCGQSLLYGLVADPCADPRLVDRAARMLAAMANGPGLGEARRRLTEGLPLIVGLSRADTDEVRRGLAGLGLVPRMGPAPEGTVPLRPAPPSRARRAAWLALAGGAALVAILLAAWPAQAPKQAAPAAAEKTTPVRLAPAAPRARAGELPAARELATQTVAAERRLELWARVVTADADLKIEGWARARTFDAPPEGALTLVGVAGGSEVLGESLPDARARTRRERTAAITRTLPFRVNLGREGLGSASELVLEATWGGWRSEPLVLEIPPG